MKIFDGIKCELDIGRMERECGIWNMKAQKEEEGRGEGGYR